MATKKKYICAYKGKTITVEANGPDTARILAGWRFHIKPSQEHLIAVTLSAESGLT